MCVGWTQKATLVTGAAEAGAYVGNGWVPLVGVGDGEALEVGFVGVGVWVTPPTADPGRVAR